MNVTCPKQPLKLWEVSTCGLAIVLIHFIPYTDNIVKDLIDCIPFCKHYIFDGEAVFCEVRGKPLRKAFQKCKQKILTPFTVENALSEFVMDKVICYG